MGEVYQLSVTGVMMRKFIALSFLLTTAPLPLLAEGYPSRPPTIVVPFAAGGPFDITGRATADALSQQLNKQFVVENRAGAGGVTGARFVMTSKPDGYTLLLGSPGPLIIAPSANPGSINVEQQFATVGIIAESPQVLVVSAKVAARSIPELIALAKAKPGGLSYGSAGVGTTPHLSAELFRKVTGVDITHVPYRGTSAAVPDLTTGDLHLMFGDVSTLRSFIDSGALTALAVTGGARSKLIPQVPTVIEAGYPELTVRNFSALLAPTGTDPVALKALAEALTRAKTDEGFVARLETQGMSAIESSPDHARNYLRTETTIWEPLVQSIGLKGQ